MQLRIGEPSAGICGIAEFLRCQGLTRDIYYLEPFVNLGGRAIADVDVKRIVVYSLPYISFKVKVVFLVNCESSLTFGSSSLSLRISNVYRSANFLLSAVSSSI